MPGRAVASDQIIRHADNIDAIRARFSAVNEASAFIASDDGAYGLLCRWITENFHEKHVRQDELVAFVAENLQLIGESLCDIAEVDTLPLDPVQLAAVASLIAPVTVHSRGGWTMEDIEPLRDVLDQLTGRPDAIASHAATWYNIAVEQQSMAEELDDFVEHDIPDWHGDEADEHRRLMGHNIAALKGLASVSAALSEITESVGVLVAQTRRLMRGLVMDLMALSVPVPASTAHRDATFARWMRRIVVYAVALNTTLTHLENRLNG